MNTPPDQLDGSTELGQLAAALTQQGYDATLITPAPYLAIRIPGATLPQIIHNTGGHYWWHTAQTIAPTRQTTLAAEMISWTLRATHQPFTHDTTSPLTATPSPPAPAYPPTTSAGGQQC